jgi:hypothetical protein
VVTSLKAQKPFGHRGVHIGFRNSSQDQDPGNAAIEENEDWPAMACPSLSINMD